MADETVHSCGHAVEAHGDGGCALCDCTDDLGRGTGVEGEGATVETPSADGGAGG